MKFTSNEKSTYLFCAQLPQTKTTPLTTLEWNAVVKSLGEHNLEPEVLLKFTSSELFNALTHAKDTQKSKILKKVEARQKLGISMLELEDITQKGYGIMFRSQMPPQLKKLTQKYIPPFFYYAGNPSILSNRLLGIVGARDASSEELLKTAEISKQAINHNIVIISGGAKGVDTTAVEAALQSGGKAVIFPADGLAKWIKKSSIREYILNGKLLVMSAQKLNAPFTGSYAMQRNKFIHAPSDAVLVTSSKISGTKRSGTWEGVLENIKMNWSPLYGIGNSEGVERLYAEGKAKPFSTFEEIYKQNISKERNCDQLNKKLEQIIQFAISNGIDKETIERQFAEKIKLNYELNKRHSEKRMQFDEDLKQINFEDLINIKND